MKVEVRLYAQLRDTLPKQQQGLAHLDIPEGSTVTTVVDSLKIPRSRPLIFMVNGKRNPEQTVLQAGDRVGIFPPVGGG